MGPKADQLFDDDDSFDRAGDAYGRGDERDRGGVGAERWLRWSVVRVPAVSHHNIQQRGVSHSGCARIRQVRILFI
jgi:hypothetical protein